VAGDGTGVAVGGGAAALSHDGGASWANRAAIPELGEPMMGYSHLNQVACGAVRIVGTGDWAGAATEDQGQTFQDVNFQASYGWRAQGAAVRLAAGGTWLAAGYWEYLARSVDGLTFNPVSFGAPTEWVYGVAPGAAGVWVAVGDAGAIWRSTNDGASFSRVAGGAGPELYAVAFDASGAKGLAVGRQGAAWLTEDAGLTWRDCHCGMDRFLGDVGWLADGTALAIGEAGFAARLDPAACQGALLTLTPPDEPLDGRAPPRAPRAFDGPAHLVTR
jgi:hypothetical protein